jgi:flavin-dependent dehydrogenase
MSNSPQETNCDVAVIGGALSGAATALLLRREDPSLKVVIIEKNDTFKRRVGEATVEVSGYFLCRVLGMTKFLTETQMTKNGLRFWFGNEHCRDLRDCSELGGKYLSTVPSFLIDRAVVDEEVLRRAESEGVEVWRPASVLGFELQEGGRQKLRVRDENGERSVSARWIVDASGVKAMLARSQGWLRPNEKHPTLSAWTRWSGTGDWDEAGFLSKRGEESDGLVGIRGTATNHLAGDGWWAWWIALKGGDTSIGVVLDQRKAQWPDDQAPVAEKLKTFLSQHPAAREMMKEATFIGGDVHFRRNLPYFSTTQAGDGFVLVGDASAFIDPLYSPGMDWITYTSIGAVRLVGAWRRGEVMEPLLEEHNKSFATSYERMFEALYEGKYDYLGDYDLMRLAFRLDIALYYLFVVRPVFLHGREGLNDPPYAVKEAWPVFRLMRGYNRRFGAMARERRQRGVFGEHNAGRREMFPGFNFRVSQLLKIIVGALAGWLWLEVTEGWRSWGKKSAAS